MTKRANPPPLTKALVQVIACLYVVQEGRIVLTAARSTACVRCNVLIGSLRFFRYERHFLCVPQVGYDPHREDSSGRCTMCRQQFMLQSPSWCASIPSVAISVPKKREQSPVVSVVLLVIHRLRPPAPVWSPPLLLGTHRTMFPLWSWTAFGLGPSMRPSTRIACKIEASRT